MFAAGVVDVKKAYQGDAAFVFLSVVILFKSCHSYLCNFMV